MHRRHFLSLAGVTTIGAAQPGLGAAWSRHEVATDRASTRGDLTSQLDPRFDDISDLVEALLLAIDHPKASQETFNICMDEPVNYRRVAEHLQATRGLASVDIQTEFHSTWLDNAKAKFLLGWRPQYDLARLVDEAYDYERADDDPRKIWYPG